ncbi:glycine betaine/proline transport system ATP-binding protein [Cellulomonas oligotrophica]|uniref:Glycine betaine/proline transport system ATP-binding protein n=1 Tax=Cellulomonas oligotrophica TaxID=931536 RepID=A0A7Y9JX22_9CELL|nr:glycine betaine/L-proline ABC transporter ATP-binding protein [Cellulomonas oligotrophica]NYD85202.1 glycine betaine/proline transport system ATP-binding protein [Cellulomonas oligotrophica]
MDVTALLRAEGVSKVFGRRPGEAVRRLRQGATRDEVRPWGTAAVIDASFEVAAGETFVVMGLSGSGKSTLIRMLNGLWRPTEGRIMLGDDDLAQVDARRLRELRRSRVSMVFQHFALLPHRTVLDNAAYPLQVQGVRGDERRRRAGEALEMVGLSGWADSLPAQLSGGMRQRVGLARALAAGTDVLLMDEAFSALDPLIRREMQDQLLELQQTLGKTVVFITHDLNEAMYLGDRIAVMRDGRIVQVGTGEEVLSAPADDYVAQFVADVDRSRVLTASSVMRSPAVTVQVTAGPRQVLRTLREHQVPAAYVVDRRRVLQGLVRDAGVVESLRQGAAALTDAVERDVTTVGPGTALADVFAPAAQSALPVPVVDDGGRLVGVVPRATLLEAMTPLDVTVEDELPHTPPDGSPLPGDAPVATTPTDRPTDAEVLA